MREIREGLFLLPGGIALSAPSRTLLVADAHLGFAHTLRRRGALVPAFDLGLPDRLVEAVRRSEAERVIFLGDVVEAPRPSAEERAHVHEVFDALGVPVTVVLGNHDRGFLVDFPEVEAIADGAVDGLLLHHGDRAPPPGEGPFVIGHFHPAVQVIDGAGVCHRVPAAVAGPRGVCLPAASPFSRGLAVTPRRAPPALLAWTGPLRRAVPVPADPSRPGRN
ncbi:metallophosphoesterase [Vulgatibacter sp.]|uniref:metallophosphoesterase n=1 Tax=Vulgatibacter sp. TaxID=1971226 RepID=UPI0035648580